MIPYLGRIGRLELGQLRSELRGRLHNWERLRPDAIKFVLVIPNDMALMFRPGYPCRIVRRVWRLIYTEGKRTFSLHSVLIWSSVHVPTSLSLSLGRSHIISF